MGCRHLVPLYTTGTTTAIKDLVLLCSTCHRMIHRSGLWWPPLTPTPRRARRPGRGSGGGAGPCPPRVRSVPGPRRSARGPGYSPPRRAPMPAAGRPRSRSGASQGSVHDSAR
ncbi:HNH endonuclease [Pseudonocardia sp. H11422]|uniref:HNH endonuclease n=1 Tax=Pseudonocardia sp. H11422 TaxID=2835866 RepID=UPI001BDCDF57|nr:HNH endonuclease [Pseudonocardia sp. H11422]